MNENDQVYKELQYIRHILYNISILLELEVSAKSGEATLQRLNDYRETCFKIPNDDK